jgi:ADP-ribose pyrophosphatase YjhB (NUDIX family)
MKTVYKVRALVTGPNGQVYAIRGNAAHVLQLPGGSRKATESPRKAIKREIREELGYEIKILAEAATIKVKRNGTHEITTCFLATIKGGNGETKLTGREAARGLRPHVYGDAHQLRKALKRTVREFGRSAAQRDLKLTTAALKAA